MADAWKQAQAWLDCQVAWIPEPTERHRDVLAVLLGGCKATWYRMPIWRRWQLSMA